MAREKIQIKKIDNATARQVTFSKRRRGLFKKAQELSILCDADVGLIVFSSTRKLFEYSSSSMDSILAKHSKISGANQNVVDPKHNMHEHIKVLNQKIDDASHFLRQMKGEDLEGLSIKELQQLEEKIEKGLGLVRLTKGDYLVKEINELQRKEIQLLDENAKLHQQMRHTYGHVEINGADQETTFIEAMESQDPQSSESITTPLNFNKNQNMVQDYETSDTSLQLGL